MAMKGYLYSPKLQDYWSLTNRWFCVIFKTLVDVFFFYSFAEMLSAYFIAPADRVVIASSNFFLIEIIYSNSLTIRGSLLSYPRLQFFLRDSFISQEYSQRIESLTNQVSRTLVKSWLVGYFVLRRIKPFSEHLTHFDKSFKQISLV